MILITDESNKLYRRDCNICKHNNNTQLTSSVLLSLILLQTRLYLLEVTMNIVHHPSPIATHYVTVHCTALTLLQFGDWGDLCYDVNRLDGLSVAMIVIWFWCQHLTFQCGNCKMKCKQGIYLIFDAIHYRRHSTVYTMKFPILEVPVTKLRWDTEHHYFEEGPSSPL